MQLRLIGVDGQGVSEDTDAGVGPGSCPSGCDRLISSIFLTTAPPNL